ncbi:beta-lactamase family protein [Massilia sp. PAMC28688]|uniref:serine hydrolase n=1 Tax=Massilia sp. PAMC28688 TaxID=2861283 RepID=UPI001C624976|nr:beta-lactamase family protein [Massilia sp. PAMC28688]
MRNLEAGEPVDHHTMFRLASVSKPVTATAAAKLGQEGRLDTPQSNPGYRG